MTVWTIMNAVVREREAELQFVAWHDYVVANGITSPLVRELVAAVTAYRSECTRMRRALIDQVTGGRRFPLPLTCGNGFAVGGFIPNPLVSIRDEVARLRDSAVDDPAFNAYESVLDLVDRLSCKHVWVNSYPGSGSLWRECDQCGMREVDQ